MPDINLNSQGTVQNFSVQDGLPFNLVFSKGSSFPTDSCAFFRLEYTANDPRIPQQQLKETRSFSRLVGGRGRFETYTFDVKYNVYQGSQQLVELKTSTDNGGLFTMNKNSGTITLNYPRDMTTPKGVASAPIPNDSFAPVFITTVDNRSMIFTSAKYELFVLITDNGNTTLHRPLYGTITRTLSHIPKLPSPQC